LVGRDEGWAGIRKILSSSFNSRLPVLWLLVSAFLLLVLGALAWTCYSLASPRPVENVHFVPLEALVLFLIMFFIGGGLDEEIGWRGYALDRILRKYNALVSSLVLAAVWILWHLPVFFLTETNQSLIPFWLWALPVIPLTIMENWIYINTRSIFAVAVFHTVGNLTHEIFKVLPTRANPSLLGFVFLTVLYYATALLILSVFGIQKFVLMTKPSSARPAENSTMCGLS
jgi:membrane protease YdiL (CAAX protease family)